ncbi:MAG TPA: SRPBCC domain-containing protein [Puia sp.]|nr:SRPBCC domain-containing protein [Puia sp.]
MENKNYHAAISVSNTPKEAFTAINNVSKWWTENIEGHSQKLDDVFTVRFGNDGFVTQKLEEVITDKKVVWLVTDCNLSWQKDKTEWKNTKMDFDISSNDDQTQIYFTHIGIVPGIECYENCCKGWDQYVKGSLYKLLTEGVGQPARKAQ